MIEFINTTAPVSLAEAETGENNVVLGRRVNGKQWRDKKKAFRPTAGQTTFELRQKRKAELDMVKAKEREMKEEKADRRKNWIQGIKDRRERKAEKERYEQLAKKMHQKRLDRLKRREKRNKMLNS